MKKEKRPNDFPDALKQEIRHERGCACALCGRTNPNITVHHALPASMGGLPVPENAILACRKPCHDHLDTMAFKLHMTYDMKEGIWYSLKEFARKHPGVTTSLRNEIHD